MDNSETLAARPLKTQDETYKHHDILANRNKTKQHVIHMLKIKK
jgi:hypothetical protein